MFSLYLQSALVNLAISVQPFVVPLFLEKQFGHLAWAFLFSAAWPLGVLVTLRGGMNVAARGGAYRRMMTLGLFFYAVYQLLLTALAPVSLPMVGALLVAFALHCGLFWLPRHVLVSFNVASQHVGVQTSTLQLMALGAGVLGPALTGILAERYSFSASFLLSGALVILSSAPLYLSGLALPPPSIHLGPAREVLRLPFSPTIHRVHFFEGVTENCFALSWAFIFMHTVGGVERLGLIVGFSALIAGVVILRAGRSFDRRNRTKQFEKATILRAIAMLSFIFVSYFPAAWLVLLLDTAYRVIDAGHATIRSAYVFGLSNRLSPAAFQYNREFALNTGRAVSAAGLAIAVWLGGIDVLWGALVVGAFAQFGWLYFRSLDATLNTAVHVTKTTAQEVA